MAIPSTTAFGEPLLSTEQLAQALGMSRRWVYEQVERNGLPAYKLGRALAFEHSAVRGWLSARRVGQWPEPTGSSPPVEHECDTAMEVEP